MLDNKDKQIKAHLWKESMRAQELLQQHMTTVLAVTLKFGIFGKKFLDLAKLRMESSETETLESS